MDERSDWETLEPLIEDQQYEEQWDLIEAEMAWGPTGERKSPTPSEMAWGRTGERPEQNY